LTAHGLFFGERHSVASPKFHASIIDDWHSQRPKVLTLAFRGAAKSTLAEEAITVIAALGQTRNCVILGESEARAAERLRSIKHNFEANDFIEGALHVGPGDIWTDTRCTLTNGVIIQAYGRYQSLRGVKHLDQRPDLIFMDDLEDKESVSTPEARHKTRQWYTSTVVPALAVGGRMRMAATPLHPEALAVTLGKTSQWVQRLYPIIYKGDDGEWVATWPAMYPVEWALTSCRSTCVKRPIPPHRLLPAICFASPHVLALITRSMQCTILPELRTRVRRQRGKLFALGLARSSSCGRVSRER
jgi:hypothetical protein